MLVPRWYPEWYPERQFMTTLKLTKPVLVGLQPKSARYVIWDSSTPGLGVQVQPSGHKSFVLKYRTRGGLQRKPTIGAAPPLTIEQARIEATRILAQVRLGADPAGDKRDERAAPTVNDAADRYMKEHARIHKKKRSADTDESNFKNHVRKRWGTRKITSITYNDVVALHTSMRDVPGAANRLVSLLSKLFNLCEAWGMRPLNSNPCRHIRKYAEKKIHNQVSELELARLARVMREAEEAFARVAAEKPREGDTELAAHPVAIAAIRLLILTGMRKSEVLNLKWTEVDFADRVLRLEDSKDQRADKTPELKVIPLNGPAEALLKAQPRIVGSPWVFPGRDRTKPFVGMPKIAKDLYDRAGLPEAFRPAHDWRHNFGTAGTGENLSLTLVGSLLGHKVASTTKRYADPAPDPQRAAADQIAGKIAAAMAPKAPT